MWVLDVKKVANELSDPFANVGAPQADNDSSNPPKKMFFLANCFDWNILYSYFEWFKPLFLMILMHTWLQNMYKNMYGSFWPIPPF